MSKDKIPTLYNKPATAPARIDQTHPPVREQTLFGKFVSGFMARLNTQTVERNTEEVRALSAFSPLPTKSCHFAHGMRQASAGTMPYSVM